VNTERIARQMTAAFDRHLREKLGFDQLIALCAADLMDQVGFEYPPDRYFAVEDSELDGLSAVDLMDMLSYDGARVVQYVENASTGFRYWLLAKRADTPVASRWQSFGVHPLDLAATTDLSVAIQSIKDAEA